MTFELERGCGYRKPNGMYLISLGKAVRCDRLPVPLVPCERCGFEPRQIRSYTWISGHFLGDHRGASIILDGKKTKPALCDDASKDPARNGWVNRFEDPVCHSGKAPRLLMWVGKKFYTPESFTAEANVQGMSKRIPEIPDGLRLGVTWILVAHPEACQDPLSWAMNWLFGDGEVYRAPGIFQAFIPRRIELILHEKDATAERIKKEEARGVSVVIIPDGAADARISWRPNEPRPELPQPAPTAHDDTTRGGEPQVPAVSPAEVSPTPPRAEASGAVP